MIMIYVGFTAVIYYVFTIQHPDGADKTPPIPPAMQCVIDLTVQFFFIYLMLWVFLTLEQFGVNLPGQDSMMNAMEAARAPVQYAPMSAILFVATRMRALQITLELRHLPRVEEVSVGDGGRAFLQRGGEDATGLQARSLGHSHCKLEGDNDAMRQEQECFVVLRHGFLILLAKLLHAEARQLYRQCAQQGCEVVLKVGPRQGRVVIWRLVEVRPRARVHFSAEYERYHFLCPVLDGAKAIARVFEMRGGYVSKHLGVVSWTTILIRSFVPEVRSLQKQFRDAAQTIAKFFHWRS